MNTYIEFSAKSKFFITFLSNNPSLQIRFAAEELSKYCTQIFGQTIRVVDRSDKDIKGLRIVVGVQPIENTSGSFDNIVVHIADSKIDIIGDSDISVIYGVYAFLEHLGCRWFYPGKNNEVVPRVKQIKLKRGDISIGHKLKFRVIDLEPLIKKDIELIIEIIDWMAKNHYTGLSYHPGNYGSSLWATDVIRWDQVSNHLIPEVKKRGIKLYANVHNLYFFLPPEKYYPKHASWYSFRKSPKKKDDSSQNLASNLLKYFQDPFESKHHYELPDSAKVWPKWLDVHGKMPVPTQICYSNPSAIKEYRKNIVNYLSSHPEIDVLGLWPSDGQNFCVCKKCKKNKNLIFEVVNDIAHELAVTFPHLLVEYIVYGNRTDEIPSAKINLSKNLLFFLCTSDDKLSIWGRWLSEHGLPGYRGNYVSADNYARQGMVMIRPAFCEQIINQTSSNGLSGISSFFIDTNSYWRNCLNLYLLGKASLNGFYNAKNIISDYCSRYINSSAKLEYQVIQIFKEDKWLPKDLTGYGKYSQKQLTSIKTSSLKIKGLLNKNCSNGSSHRLAQLLTYFEFVDLVFDAFMMRQFAQKNMSKNPSKAISAMLNVAKKEECMLEKCLDSSYRGDNVLDLKFFVSRRWERFDKDKQLILNLKKYL